MLKYSEHVFQKDRLRTFDVRQKIMVSRIAKRKSRWICEITSMSVLNAKAEMP